MKKIIILSVLLIVLAGVGFFAWQYFSKSSDSGLGGVFAPPPPPPVAPAPEGPVKKVSSGALVAYFAGDASVLGVEPTGRVVKIENGANTAISTADIDSLISASFSYDGKKILAKFGSKTDPLWSIFDVDSAAWTPIADMKLSAAAWAPDSQTIAYLEKVGDKKNLGTLRLGAAPAATTTAATSTAKKATSAPAVEPPRKTLTAIALTDYDVFWLSPNELILSTAPSKTATAFALRYDIKENKFSPITYAEAGTMFRWDARGGQGLKFYTSKNKYYLMLVDSAGAHLQELNFTTFPNKCAFAENFLYCGVPREGLPVRIVLPDDYLKLAYLSNDDLYKINLLDGSIGRVFDGASMSLDATDLRIKNSALYFLNRLDGELYRFDMPATPGAQ